MSKKKRRARTISTTTTVLLDRGGMSFVIFIVCDLFLDGVVLFFIDRDLFLKTANANYF